MISGDSAIFKVRAFTVSSFENRAKKYHSNGNLKTKPRLKAGVAITRQGGLCQKTTTKIPSINRTVHVSE